MSITYGAIVAAWQTLHDLAASPKTAALPTERWLQLYRLHRAAQPIVETVTERQNRLVAYYSGGANSIDQNNEHWEEFRRELEALYATPADVAPLTLSISELHQLGLTPAQASLLVYTGLFIEERG